MGTIPGCGSHLRWRPSKWSSYPSLWAIGKRVSFLPPWPSKGNCWTLDCASSWTLGRNSPPAGSFRNGRCGAFRCGWRLGQKTSKRTEPCWPAGISRGRISSDWPGWCGDEACEDKIKEETMATIRVIPLNQEAEGDAGDCVYCRRKGRELAYFARAY